MARKIVLAGAVRTPIGKMGGTLSTVPAVTLGTIVIKEALRRANLSPDKVDEVVMGCTLQAGLGQNVARQASIHAGIPFTTPAFTLNNVCGSGLKSVNVAAALVSAGEADVVVAGGMENMSAAPFAIAKARFGYRMNNGVLEDLMIKDALWDAFNNYHMGITAENVAEKYGITREMQDEFAASSQQKAIKAIAAGTFKDEIIPVEVKQKKQTVLFDTDEGPRKGVTPETLSKLRPAFKPDGTVTAGNASGINDGAAAIIVTTEEKAKELGITPMATWVAGQSAGVDPAIMGIGPAFSTKKILEKTGLTVDDLDVIELNEAFASQSVAVCNLLNLDRSKVNVNGGAIALGHPVGASGCRILITLLYEMQRKKATYGLAALCVGGGMGVSSIIKMGE